jgi:hypothetical protein
LHSAATSEDEIVMELASEIQKRLPSTVQNIEEDTTPRPGGATQAKHLHLTLKGLVNKDVNTRGLDKEKVNG